MYISFAAASCSAHPSFAATCPRTKLSDALAASANALGGTAPLATALLRALARPSAICERSGLSSVTTPGTREGSKFHAHDARQWSRMIATDWP